MYSMEFNGFKGTFEAYRDIMDTYHIQLELLSNISLYQNLADNLLLWTSWKTLDVSDDQLNLFQMTGDPVYVFNNEYIFGQIATVYGECYVPASSTIFDIGSGKLRNSYPINDYMDNENCSIISPESLGYKERFNGETFIIEFDVSSAITAIAVSSVIL